MTKGRMEAFSDGVIAILITIMVLELKVPHGTAWSSLRPMLPELLSYILSFVFVGIYWNNHHHLLHTASKVSGGILWANLHLLFWLSLIPLATGWMGENHTAAVPCSAYGVVMLGAAIAYYILQETIVAHHGPDSRLRAALGSDLKAKFSLACYAAAIALAYVSTWIAIGLYTLVAGMWLVPDRRYESAMRE
jgi:TMEM175 potassium channel family protein